MKPILKYILGSLLVAYLLFTYIFAQYSANHTSCQGARIEVADSANIRFVTRYDVETLLEQQGFTFMDTPMGTINTHQLETQLEQNPYIVRAECYKTLGGWVNIEIEQRTPILRINSGGENYYVDAEGVVMPYSTRTRINLPIATGYITPDYAREKLYTLAQEIYQNSFWNAQIEQIYVDKHGEVELVPRVGGERILLGEPIRIEEKLHALRSFYDQVITRVGWKKYSVINLKYKGQIVCTK